MSLSEIIKQAIGIGVQNGRITFGQIDDLFQGRKTEPEEIEELMAALSEAEIWVEED